MAQERNGLPGCLVVTYHAVTENEQDARHENHIDAVSVTRLALELDWLASNFRIVPLDELFTRLAAGHAIDGLAAITFDDGARSVVSLALPLIQAKGLPATLFVVTSLAEGQPFWRDQVRWIIREGREEAFLVFAAANGLPVEDMRARHFYRDSKNPERCSVTKLPNLVRAFCELSGASPSQSADQVFCSFAELKALQGTDIVIGNHSHRHLVMAGLPDSEQLKEINKAQERLQEFGLLQSKVFAVPFGGPNSYDAGTVEAVRKAGLSAMAVTSSAEGWRDARDLSGHNVRLSVPTLTRVLPTRIKSLV